MEPAADRHAYRAEDRALLLGFYRWLFWDRLVAALPRRLTPNMITVGGESCAILAAVATFGAARWPVLHLVCAALLFVYMTGDNVDGPHARRTGQTSVLGELLDHGLDGLASCAVLLTSAVTLGLDGAWLAAIAALAGLSFFTTFWGQFRTGFLVTPQLSAMEGVTGAAVFQVLVFALGSPAWLRFSLETVNPATIVVAALVICYVIAVVAPLVRAGREGAPVAEVLPIAALVAVIAAAAFRGAGGYLPTIALSLVIAELVCRMILHRHRDDLRGVLRPAHALHALPWLAICAGLGPTEILAWLGVGGSFAAYAWSFGSGCALLARKK